MTLGRRKRQCGIAVIGCGNVATYGHLPAVAASPRARLLYAVDSDAARAEQAAQRWDATAATDYRVVLADRRVEAVIVATPPETTPRVAIAALAAGKHVLSEKPMATTLDLGRAVRAAAQSGPGVYQIGFILRYNPLYQRLHQLAPRVGAPRAIRVAVAEEAYRPQNTVHLARTQGALRAASAMAHDGAHLADLLLWLAGDEQPRTVGAWTLRGRPSFAGPNHWLGTAGLSGGSVGQVEVAWLYPGDLRAEVTIMGPGGVLRGATRATGEDAPHQASLSAQWEDGTSQDEQLPTASPDFAGQLARFIASMESGAAPTPGVDEALRSLALTQAFEQAASRGAIVEVSAV